MLAVSQGNGHHAKVKKIRTQKAHGACSEDHAESLHIVAWSSTVHHLNGTACQSKSHRP